MSSVALAMSYKYNTTPQEQVVHNARTMHNVPYVYFVYDFITNFKLYASILTHRQQLNIDIGKL